VVDDAPTAGDLYVATVEAPQRGVAKRVGAATVRLLSAAFGDAGEVTSAGDVVVRRRADDGEVLRVPGGPSEELAWTLQSVNEQLENLSPVAFRETWDL
jgi:hypothetical protein